MYSQNTAAAERYDRHPWSGLVLLMPDSVGRNPWHWGTPDLQPVDTEKLKLIASNLFL